MFKELAFAVMLAMAPVLASAHGPTPAARHGGVVEEASENWLELVLKNDQLTVYVNDERHQPVANGRLGGKASVLAAGKKQDIALAPGEGNSLTGKVPTPVMGKATAVLSLTIDGKPIQARFSFVAPAR